MKPALSWSTLSIADDDGDAAARVMTDEQTRYECNVPFGEGTALVTFASDFYYGCIFTGRRRHALAALCLHGQPFGFTREDVLELLSAAEILSGEWGWPEKDAPGLLSIADRIEALLPPEGT